MTKNKTACKAAGDYTNQWMGAGVARLLAYGEIFSQHVQSTLSQ